MLSSIGKHISFGTKKSVPLENITSTIKKQLPVHGACLKEVSNVVDELPFDYLEIVQDDGATKYITAFVDDKKIMEEEIYNNKKGLITLWSPQTNTKKTIKRIEAGQSNSYLVTSYNENNEETSKKQFSQSEIDFEESGLKLDLQV